MLRFCLAALLSFTPLAAHACKISVNGPGYAMIDVLAGKSRGKCNISKFPKPWNSMLGIKQGTSRAFHWAYEPNQHVYVMFQINKKGKGRVIFHYTNDKQTDGDTFVAHIVLKDKNGKAIGYIGSQRGVNARRTGDDIKNLNESPEYWKSVRYLEFEYGYYDSVDDKVVWDAAKAAASTAACAYGGVCVGG